MNFDRSLNRAKIERDEDWRNICNAMPPLHFRSDWFVTIIPPFAGAVARFLVASNGKEVSVYADWFGALGAMKQPYWEIYPNSEGDTSRFYINETDELLAAIQHSLDSNQKQPESAYDD